MAARREITKNYAREYGRANRTKRSRLLDALVKTTGWDRARPLRRCGRIVLGQRLGRDDQRARRNRADQTAQTLMQRR